MNSGLRVRPLSDLPLIVAGDDLAALIREAAVAQGEGLGADVVVVVAQKIVSKAEGRSVRLADVRPGARAEELAKATGRPPALAQLILDESSEILRAHPAAIITRHRSGHVLANAGIDASNVGRENAGAVNNVGTTIGAGGEDGTVLLWPQDADASARVLRAGLRGDAGAPAVVIADSMGRAWRIGTLGTAIGVAGLAALEDRRGELDLFGRTLQATVVAVADAIAAAAVLVMGEGAEGTPVAIVSGAGKWISAKDGPGATAGLRPIEQDMFR